MKNIKQLSDDFVKIEDFKDLEQYLNLLKLQLTLPAIILLTGNLGAGKTTFTKYFCKAYGLNPNKVKSPTFSLINNYKINDLQINHLDLYRLNQLDQFLEQELLELIQNPNSITLIEWPDRIKNLNKFKKTANLYQLSINIPEQNNNARLLKFKKI